MTPRPWPLQPLLDLTHHTPWSLSCHENLPEQAA